jgi:transcriptional regulator of acetoin/glycerol metabolism
MIREGRFREDLYYRLNVIDLAIPPLAKRVDDIVPIAENFVGTGLVLSDEARVLLLGHSWPGNVRELKNAIDRAKLLCRDGILRAADFNLPPPRPGVRGAAEPDRVQIEEALARAGGVVSRAASSLGLSRQAFYRRLEKFGLAGEASP